MGTPSAQLPAVSRQVFYKTVMATKARAVRNEPIFTIGPLCASIDSAKLPGEFLIHDLFKIDRRRIGLNEDDR